MQNQAIERCSAVFTKVSFKKPFPLVQVSGVFKTQSKICDAAFL